MDWLQALDNDLFRFGNEALTNPLFDKVMPLLSGNAFFIPLVLFAVIMLLWKGGARGRLCVLFLFLVVAIGDGLICSSIKDAVGRARPFNDLPETILRIGAGGSGSMPSSHSANWFSLTVVLWVFYRRSWKFFLPMACLVAFSRVYNGVHYPSDVLAGALLGTVYGFAIVYGMDALWRRVVGKWFPHWFARVPSLILAEPVKPASAVEHPEDPQKVREAQWLRLGYALTFILLILRLGYHAAGKIELSEDEAYQWLWSKHLALSYFSKPPLIAYTQWLGTTIWGDNALGVRFFASVISAAMAIVTMRFFAREVGVRPALWTVLLPLSIPLLAVGSILMTIDPLNVFFWMLAMFSGWRAVKTNSTGQWLLVGLWMGLGFLSKYTALFQLLSWAVFFIIYKPARPCLRTKGPWLALLVNAVCTIPVLIWNAQHHWITVEHLASRGGLDKSWHFTLRFFFDFLLVEPLLFNPVIFIGMIWAAIAFWKKDKGNQLMIYFFSMGMPLFLFYFLYTFRARVQPNWIAPAILPLMCLAIVYWENRYREGVRWFKPVLIIGFSLFTIGLVLLHDTNLLGKLAGRYIAAYSDPLHRVRGWEDVASRVEAARENLEKDGHPAFIIGGHYGITGLLSFYIPEARETAQSSSPLVYYRWSEHPENQFYFWPTYRDTRKGQNAIYVLVDMDEPQKPPQSILDSFDSVKDLGMQEAKYRGRDYHRFQMFECRNLH